MDLSQLWTDDSLEPKYMVYVCNLIKQLVNITFNKSFIFTNICAAATKQSIHVQLTLKVQNVM